MPLVDINGRRVELDTNSADYNAGYLVTVDIEHHKIHDGVHFRIYDYDNEVDTLTPKYWAATTPATGYSHVTFRVAASNAGLLEGFGGSTVSDLGVEIASSNGNAASSNTAGQKFYKDPTVTDDGVQVFVEYFGSGGKQGGVINRTHEVIAPQDTTLLFKFTPDANDTQISVSVAWYEVGDNTVDP